MKKNLKSCSYNLKKLVWWNVRIIILLLSFRAPPDCRQYFTGATGSFKSYNFAGGVLLASQQYTNCFRQEQGKENSTTTVNNATKESKSWKCLNGLNFFDGVSH